jgi:hypothetical protein
MNSGTELGMIEIVVNLGDEKHSLEDILTIS